MTAVTTMTATAGAAADGGLVVAARDLTPDAGDLRAGRGGQKVVKQLSNNGQTVTYMGDLRAGRRVVK